MSAQNDPSDGGPEVAFVQPVLTNLLIGLSGQNSICTILRDEHNNIAF